MELNKRVIRKTKELLEKVPEFAEKAHPFFVVGNWEWTHGVPTIEEIEENTRRLVGHVLNCLESELPSFGSVHSECGRILVMVSWYEDSGIDADIRLVPVSVGVYGDNHRE